LFLSAEAGYEKAQLALAQKYEKGEGIEKNPDFSFYWYGKAALQEETAAYFPLGYAYEKGIVTKQDFERAFYFYKLASKGTMPSTSSAVSLSINDGRADIRLGKMYLKGKGCKPSEQLALEYFNRASNVNNADGHYYMGLMRFTGKGYGDLQPEQAKFSF